MNYLITMFGNFQKKGLIIKQQRKCGEDIFTKPIPEELHQLLEVTTTTTPELLIQLREEKNESSPIHVTKYNGRE